MKITAHSIRKVIFLFLISIFLGLPSYAFADGIWITGEEIQKLPMSGPAWENIKNAADGDIGTPLLSDQDSHHPQNTMAVALSYARTGTASYRARAVDAIMGIVGEDPGRSLALGRNLAAYVISADLINLRQYSPAKDQQFRAWLSPIRFHVNSEGRSLVTCHEERPNNWGTMCGASRITADIYLGDAADLDRAAKIFKGYLGNRSSYAGFQFQHDSFSWMCDSSNPRPLNPIGCVKNGHILSGAPVDDVQRGGAYTWLPNPTFYAWGGFSGAVAQAEMLHRAGYSAYDWEDKAILRGMIFLNDAMPGSNSGPTEWMPWVVNHHYGTNFPAKTLTGMGRLIGWTDWTHSGIFAAAIPCPWDTTGPNNSPDGKVSLADVLILANDFGKKPGDIGYDAKEDFDGVAGISLGDLLIVISHIGNCPVS